MNREKAREYFQRCDLDYSMVNLEDIDKLVQIVSEELQSYLESGGEHAQQMNMRVSKLRKKDVKVLKKSGLQYARIQIDGSYFKRREGITFSHTGFIGFGCEFSDVNVEPILKAFVRWCDYVVEKPKVKQQVLELINSMPIKYYDNDIIGGNSIIYIATVEDNDNNRSIIKSLGYSEQEVERFISCRNGEIDITNFVWNYANWFDGEKFIVA